MKIEGLKVANYRPWGNVSLDLAHVRGAVITGGNGLGKSSLLEAVLWCLYGKSRSASADGVVRIGTEAATVEVEVQVAKGRYRVRRTRSLKGQGKTTVALEWWDGQAWAAVGGAGKRGTDEAIVEALGVDYDTLLATSVAVQGDAGRFTRAQPAERRAVLATMLDLDRWAEDAGACRARAKECEREAEGHERQVRADAAELVAAAEARAAEARDGVAARAAAVEPAEAGLRACERDLTLAEAQAQAAAQTAAEARAKRAEATELATRATAAQGRARDAGGLRERLRAAQEAADLLPSALTADEACQAALARGRQAEADRQACLGALGRAQAEAEGLTAQVAQARAQLGDVAALEARAAGLAAAEAAEAAAAADLARVAAEGAPLKERREALAGAPQALATAQGYRAHFGAELSGAEAEARALGAQAKLIGEVPCGGAPMWVDPADPGVTVCNLAGSCQLLASARDAAQRLETLETRRLPELRAAVAKADAEVAAAQVELAELAELSARRDALAEQYRAAQAAERAAQAQAQDARHAAERLAVAQALRETLAGLEAKEADAQAKATNLAAALPAAVDLRAAEAAARAATDRVRQLEASAAGAEGLRAQLEVAEGAEAEARRLFAESGSATAAAAALEAQATGAPERLVELRMERERLASALQGARDALRDAEAHQQAAALALARAQDALAASEQARAAAVEARAEAVAWLRTAKACGAAPTYKLESRALPMIEAEANRVLSVLSHRGMRLELRTQRDLKSADHKRETLDIVVRDDAGERLYEDFSGGEQFRIDLALRLALARLLSARAGAQVELLVIDEGGFGALDPAGIEACKETLQRLDSFGQVLVVTHLDALADALPHRIVVSAGPDGSVAEVV